MRDLACDDVADLLDARLARIGQAQHVGRAGDRGQRVPQLVRQHGEEFVLAPVGQLQSFFRVAMQLRLHKDLEEGLARIEEDKTDISAYLRVARVYELGKDFRAALAVLSEGVENNPKSGELWVHIGLLESTLEREREALAAKEAGIDGVPCFILGGTFAVSGAQAPEYLADAIERASREIGTQSAAE